MVRGKLVPDVTLKHTKTMITKKVTFPGIISDKSSQNP